MTPVKLYTIASLCFFMLLSCGKKQDPRQVALEQGRLTQTERVQLEIGRMHFNNGDFELARKEYVRMAINHPSGYVQELSTYMVGESFFKEGDFPQAARYFQQYILEFPSGYRRQEAEVRLIECDEMRRTAERLWTTGRLRKEEKVAAKPEPAPQRKEPPVEVKRFKTTWYWIVNEEEFEQKDMVPVFDPNEQVVATVPQAFYKRLLIEGTGRLRDGRTLNWAKPQRFIAVGENTPYGLGAIGNPLIPLRTIAVDRTVIELGAIVYIPEFNGLILPSGEKHDGCFVAGDVGSAIKGFHIDLFSPVYKAARKIMSEVPEKMRVQRAARHCKASYEVADGFLKDWI